MADRLYNLLPAIYRIRDAAEGEPLRALLAAIEYEVLAPIEAEIGALRDSATIETCPDWAIPYIGDLLGVRTLRPGGPGNLRGYVANALAYRRRKGTAAVVEQLARDVTGLPARVVEYFELLATSQNDDHVRPTRSGTLDIRSAARMQLLNGPFEDAPYTVEMRRAARGGRYNVPNVGLFLWRLSSFVVERGQAFRVAEGQFCFNPLGLDAPLFNLPQTESEITALAAEQNVPEPLRRLALHAELEQVRAGKHTPIWFGEVPVLTVFADPDPYEPAVDPLDLHICNLANWRRPADGVAIDPELGRLAFPAGVDPATVLVSYSYGFAGDVGASPAPRTKPAVRPPTWQVGVSQDHKAVGLETIFTSLDDAVAAWNALPSGQSGVIVLMDSHSYALGANPLQIRLKEGSQLLLIGAQWPALELLTGAPGVRVRSRGRYEPRDVLPCIQGNLQLLVEGPRAELLLDGLLIAGSLTLDAAESTALVRLRACTLALRAHPTLAIPPTSLLVQRGALLTLELQRCITGPVAIAAPLAALHASDSIIAALDAPASPATINACTLLGTMRVRSLETSDSLYRGACVVERRQEGCARFSFFGPGSQTPRRYRCQPDMAVAARAEAFAPNPLPPAEAARVERQLQPQFVSLRYGDPGFAQLHTRTPAELRSGAESGAEMGAFEHRKLALGELNLRAVLEDYLPFGLEAGIFYRS